MWHELNIPVKDHLRALKSLAEIKKSHAVKKKKSPVVNNGSYRQKGHVPEAYSMFLWKTSGIECIEMRSRSTCTPGWTVSTAYIHFIIFWFLQGSLRLTNYSLEWKCSYCFLKPSARLDINHVHLSFAPFNLYPDWLLYVLFAQQPCQASFFFVATPCM